VKYTIKAITIGALTAGMVAVPAVSAFAATTPVTAPEITSVYMGGANSPLGQYGSDRTAYIQNGTATIGGQVESRTAISKVQLVSGDKTLCTDTTIEGTAGSYVFSCDVVVPKGLTVIKAVAFQGTEHAASDQSLRLTNYATQTPGPVTPVDPGAGVTPPPVAAIDAPKVSLVENFGLQRRASIKIEGQKLAGSEFVVTLNGKEQRLDAATGQAIAFVSSTTSGNQFVGVKQVLGSTTSAFGTLRVNFGDTSGTTTPTPTPDPVATVDPTRPTDPGFTVTPPPVAAIDAPKVSLVENFGLQRRASIKIEGQKLAGSEFVVSVGGKQQRLDASSGQAVAFVESPYSGSQTVRVLQVSGSTSSTVGLLTVKFGDTTVTPVQPVSPVVPVDPTRPTDPGFTVTPPTSSTISAPKVSLIENFGFQRRASILIQGQKLAGSEFLVTLNGTTERFSGSTGQAVAFVSSKTSGPQTVRVTQVSGETSSTVSTFSVNFF
jgi:hypothetical protein